MVTICFSKCITCVKYGIRLEHKELKMHFVVVYVMTE